MPPDHTSDAVLIANKLIESRYSLLLSTAGDDGKPLASYAPFYRDSGGSIFILVSSLSAHTNNLLRGIASILVIEDESECRQIFARTRLGFQCTCHPVSRESQEFEPILDKMDQRHRDRYGDIVNTLKGLADFTLFRLEPHSGSFVMGFGQAYTIDRKITSAIPVTPNK